MRKSTSGFTIVELLIVIVVIGVLAAITTVSYNGIQARAKNVSIQSAAKQSLNLISAYIASNSNYPYTGSSSCVSEGCVWGAVITTPSSPNATLKTNLQTIGTLPGTVPETSSGIDGIAYAYSSSRTVNGVSAPAILIYGLEGTAQNCGLAGLVNGSGDTLSTVSTPYSTSYPNNTSCIVSISAV